MPNETTTPVTTPATARHRIEPRRWEPRRRSLTVAAIEQVTPRMRRLQFTAPDWEGFASYASDDHVKLFVPAPGAAAIGRHYTVRRFDAGRGLLTIDFALHGVGPASEWAERARVGDVIDIGGPKKSLVVADDFDWYLLVGDETALPAIGRRLEELRPDVPVVTVIAVDGDDERQAIETRAAWRPIWIARDQRHRHHEDGDGDGPALLAAIEGFDLPPGDGYVWIAAEARAARAVRDFMLGQRRHPAAWLKSSGYWVDGEPGAHE